MSLRLAASPLMPDDSPSTATTTSARAATATASATISCGERLSTGISAPNAFSVSRSIGIIDEVRAFRVQNRHRRTGHIADPRLDADRLLPVAGGAATAQQILPVIRQRTHQSNSSGFIQGQDLPVVLQQDERLLRDFPRGFPVFRREDFTAGPFRRAAAIRIGKQPEFVLGLENSPARLIDH